MDVDEWILHQRLGPDFPLPPYAPFTRPTALEAGLTGRALTRLHEAGLLTRPVRGVYLPAGVEDSLATRVACMKLVAPPDAVVVDRHAGWLHGAEMVLAPGEHLHLRPLSLFLPAGRGRLRNDITDSGERDLLAEEVTEIDGLRVTTPLRTTWDLGRVRWPSEAIAALDAMFRLGAFDRDEFLAGIGRFKGMRWVTTLRAVGPLADGRSESPPESILRLRSIEAGLHLVPQVEIWDGSRFVARVDLGDEEERFATEYDGAEWHSTPAQLGQDRARRQDAAELGWHFEVFRKEDLFSRTDLAEVRLRQAWHRRTGASVTSRAH